MATKTKADDKDRGQKAGGQESDPGDVREPRRRSRSSRPAGSRMWRARSRPSLPSWALSSVIFLPEYRGIRDKFRA